MVDYLAMRIESGNINYNQVIKKHPEVKKELAAKIRLDGYTIKKNGDVVKRTTKGKEK